MNLPKRKYSWQVLLSLLLLCLFTAAALMVVVFGARVYKNSVAGAKENFDRRTAVSYLAEKVRQFDTAGAVSVLPLGDGDALVLNQSLDAGDYATWIYLYDGSLREVMAPAGAAPQPESGQKILPLTQLRIEKVGDSALRVSTVGESGAASELVVHTHCS